MSIYKMYGNAPSNADSPSIANLDIQNDGFINAITIAATPKGMDAIDDAFLAEISFMSSSSFTINDVKGSLLMLAFSQQFLTTGGGIGNSNITVSGLKIPVNAGERIHLHSNTSAGVTGGINAYVHVDDGVGDDRPARRRR